MSGQATEIQANADSDEIELIDYINVLCRRKTLVLGGTILCVVLAAAVSFLLPPVYRVDTVLHIGKTSRVIEKPANLLAKIENGLYDGAVRDKTGIDIPGEFHRKIKAEHLKNTSLVRIYIDSAHKVEAAKVLAAMDDLILADHMRMIDVDEAVVKSRIRAVEEEIVSLEKEKARIQKDIDLTRRDRVASEKELKEIGDRIRRLQKEERKISRSSGKDKTLLLLLLNSELQYDRLYSNRLHDRLDRGIEKDLLEFMTRFNVNNNSLNSLVRKKTELELQLKTFRKTKIIKDVTVSENPVSPKIRLNILLTGIAGLFFFVFLAFFLEYFKSAKERENLAHMGN
ncbi:MAG: hypothetical protein GXP58_03265 [Deltaproteobacteria bacterium]|nr:hypothetical protein [Deltaproteobacteria bacterium]